MPTNSETEFYKSLFYSPLDTIEEVLDMLMLIDIGIITEIDANGRATVSTSVAGDGVPLMLTDVEVIGLGNRHGAFTVDGGGCTCLLFVPRTCVPNVRDANINASLPVFSNTGAKALPISNGRELSVNAYFSPEGTLTINTGSYQLCFEEHRVSYFCENGLAINLDDANTLYVYRRGTTSGALEMTLNDDGFVSSFTNRGDNIVSTYTTSVMNDGTVSLRHHAPPAHENEPPKLLNEILIIEDGTLSLTVGTDDEDAPNPLNKLVITPTGAVTLTVGSDEGKPLTTVSIDAEGKVSIITESDITTETEGNINATVGGDVSISAGGNTSITADGDVSIESGGDLALKGSNVTIDGTFNVNSGNLEVTK